MIKNGYNRIVMMNGYNNDEWLLRVIKMVIDSIKHIVVVGFNHSGTFSSMIYLYLPTILMLIFRSCHSCVEFTRG